MANKQQDAAAPVRKISRKARVELPRFGFAGGTHVAVEVFGPSQFERMSPFFLLTDNELGFAPGQAMGAPMAHAGLETVQFIIEGGLKGAQGVLQEGDVSWIGAGPGVIHDPYTSLAPRGRVLQLWSALPQARQSELTIRVIRKGEAVSQAEQGAHVRLYGRESGITPLRDGAGMADVQLEGAASTQLLIAAHFRCCIYVLGGALRVGGTQLFLGDVGWVEPLTGGETSLRLTAWAHGARAIVFAAAPLKERIFHRGLIAAASTDGLADKLRASRLGLFPSLGDVWRDAEIGRQAK